MGSSLALYLGSYGSGRRASFPGSYGVGRWKLRAGDEARCSYDLILHCGTVRRRWIKSTRLQMVYPRFISSYHTWEKQPGYKAINQFILASSKSCYLDTTYERHCCNLASYPGSSPYRKVGRSLGRRLTYFPHCSYWVGTVGALIMRRSNSASKCNILIW